MTIIENKDAEDEGIRTYEIGQGELTFTVRCNVIELIDNSIILKVISGDCIVLKCIFSHWDYIRML